METEAEDTGDEVIRMKLRKQLEQSGMSSAVRKMVRQICSAKSNVEEINPDEVIDEVYKQGLVAGLIERADKHLSKHGKQKDLIFQTVGKSKTKYCRNCEGDIFDTNGDLESDDEYTSSDDDLIDKTLRKSGKYYLKVEVKGGESFLDNIFEEIPSTSLKSREENMGLSNLIKSRSKLLLHIFFKSQRFTSKKVECCCDPLFNEIFLIEVECFNKDDGSVASKLLDINEPLQIMIVREDVNSQRALGGTLIAYCSYDWRSVLVAENGIKRFPLELMGIGPLHNVCVGILQLRCSLIPTPRERIADTTYLDRVNDEKATQEDFDRSFVAEAKRWWSEYIQIRAEHQFRLIRLFAYDEKMTARPVMTFVKPVVVDDLLASPFQAAWFVSLLPTIESLEDYVLNNENHGGIVTKDKPKDWILPGIQNGIGGCLLSERWQNIDATIISKSGTVEDHAVLLTSLLLTFGLDAFVVLGTKKGKGSWAWVATMSESQEPTFWESITGEYYEHYSYPQGVDSYDRLPSDILKKLAKNKMYNFLTVSCVFNDKGLYANVQATTSIDFLDWNLDNPSKWKFLPLMDYFAQRMSSSPIRILNSTVNWDFFSRKMEFMLRNFICCARKDHGMETKWDDQFEQYMGQHLFREEMEVSTGGKDFKDYFRTVTLKCLPPGYDFRARSFHSLVAEAQDLFEQAMREPLMQGIILTRGQDVRHSMKVKIFSYPEDVASVRFIIACKYIPTG